MMHNIGPFHVNGNVLTKHGRTVGEPAMLIMRTEDFCVPVKIGSKEYISAKFIPDYLRQWDFGLYVSGLWHIFAKIPRGIMVYEQ